MVSNLAVMIERILQNLSPREFYQNVECGSWISLKKLKKIYFMIEDNLSEPSIEKGLEYSAEWIDKKLQEFGYFRNSDSGDAEKIGAVDFLELVECFSEKVLIMQDNEKRYRYKYLEPWHEVSAKVGEDLFVACSLACDDVRKGDKRRSFFWKWILDHDNYELQRMLQKGVSDNHYHLRASSPYYDLAWSSMMNSVVDIKTIQFMHELDRNSRVVKKRYVTDDKSERYEILHLKAALIRLYLYSVFSGRFIKLGTYPVSAQWILSVILEKEGFSLQSLGLDLRRKVAGRTSHLTLEKYLESIYLNTNKGKNIRRQLRISSPGFYWFFWERFPGIPVSVLSSQWGVMSGENLRKIGCYADACYRVLDLGECEEIFMPMYREMFYQEWRKQTKICVQRLLCDSVALIAARGVIQSMVDGLQTGKRKYKDYLLTEVSEKSFYQQEQTVICGERWLLYTMFYRWMQSPKDSEEIKECSALFLAYLIIKNQFRTELTYNNDKVGFANFSAYQKRKDWFTTSFSEAELARSAVWEAFRKTNLKSLELRILPGVN